ncbi:MAG: hypothetical protein C5S40_03415 [ANME-2 cluster archaeon]|nr:hypothetical protein [ANME-2 cluster archaeon]
MITIFYTLVLINTKVGAYALHIRFVAATVLMVEKRGVTIVY